jgi:hypothetical protein
MSKDATDYLSKSLFMRGIQCPKSLYFHKYNPEWRDETSETQENLFQSGAEVGLLARELFPGGIEIPYDGHSHNDQIKETEKALNDGIQTLYEATFSFDNIFVKNDLLHKGKKGWELYEVKMKTELTEVYLNDVALQYYVVKGTGLPIQKAFVVYINNQYVRNGAIDPARLFVVEEVTDKVIEKKEWVKDEVNKLRRMLSGKEPELIIGKQCNDPYPCDFIGHCWEHVPDNSVFDLKGRGMSPFDLYQQGYLDLKEVPRELLAEGQKFQLDAFLNQEEVYNPEAIREFFKTLWYPLYFLDFETIMDPIPPFNGTRPYQQIPFQYSLHYLEKEKGKLGHHEFLGDPNSDFREELLQRLCNQIPPTACVIAYNASFEKVCLQNLADWFPNYKEKIEVFIQNLRDMAIPFRRKDVYHWEMKGSYSLKNVLPCLLPDLTYSTLEIQDGGMAMNAFRTLSETSNLKETIDLRQALLDYCRLDSLAMVKIVEKLKEKCRG